MPVPQPPAKPHETLNFEAIFLATASACLILNLDFVIVGVNEGYLRVTQRTREDLIGKHIFDAFPNNPQASGIDSVEYLHASLQRVLAHRVPDKLIDLKYDIPVRTGGHTEFEERYWSPVNTPVFDQHGKLLYIIHEAEDVTARRAHEQALRESEIRFRALSSATADVIYRMSPDWKYMHELDGRGFLKTTTELAEYRIEEYVYPDDLDLARAAIAHAICTKTVFELEHRVLRADGTCGWTYSKAVPILEANGEIREWVGSASDITKRKIVEQELTDASRRKDEFLAMLAHELRNPLSPVLSAAEMLRIVSHSDERVTKASGVIVRQVRHLSALVDDLLDVSRVTRGLVHLNLEAVEFRRVIDNAVEQSKPLLEARKHSLTLDVGDGPHLIFGDRNRLVQVVVNLLNNAIKYTPELGRIKVTLQNEGNQVIVTVEDNGVGIDADLLPHIFELFTQAERQADRSHGGLGIGLALAKTIVEMHGGAIAVCSAGNGKGSMFSASFPVIHRPEQP